MPAEPTSKSNTAQRSRHPFDIHVITAHRLARQQARCEQRRAWKGPKTGKRPTIGVSVGAAIAIVAIFVISLLLGEGPIFFQTKGFRLISLALGAMAYAVTVAALTPEPRQKSDSTDIE